MESIKSDANVANVQCFYPLEANIETTGQCCILLGSEFYFKSITTRLDWDCVDSSYDSKEIHFFMCQLQIHFCPIYWFYVLLSCHCIILAISWSRWTAMTEERSVTDPVSARWGRRKLEKVIHIRWSTCTVALFVSVLNCGAGYPVDFLDSSEQYGQTMQPLEPLNCSSA